MNKSQEIPSHLIKSREDPSVVFDFAKEALDQMSFFVLVFVILAFFYSILFRWYYRFRTHCHNRSQYRVGIIAFIIKYPNDSFCSQL